MNRTKIEWTDATWNPVTGCTKFSPGCANCYAERMAKRLAGRFGYPKDEPFKVTLHEDRITEPLKWRKPRRVFVCSMGDLFHEDVKAYDIMRIFNVMAQAKQHTFMVLTKRPERMLQVYRRLRPGNTSPGPYFSIAKGPNAEGQPPMLPSNIWVGVTAENQEVADKRISTLLQIPATIRFVSIEPMLGPIDLTSIPVRTLAYPWSLQKLNWKTNVLTGKSAEPQGPDFKQHLDWVIVGGETGPGARPMHPDWVRSIRDQCRTAGVPFFFKGWGEWGPELCVVNGNFMQVVHGFADGTFVYRNGHAVNGRYLDGHIWHEYPEVGRKWNE